jgi:AraC-like DNA-binding protein
MDSLILALSEETLGAEEEPKSSDSSLKRIIDYINANLTTIKTMDDIADALFFSKSYLGHLFKKETNMGIMEYVRNKKVVRAHTLILNGEKPTEIYLECGFSNYPSFYRAYTSFFGFSPRMKKGDG